MILFRQGYFKEMPHGEETDPSIKDFINKSVAQKEEICNYLNNGMVLAACGKVEKDILHPERGIAGTPDDMTDGKWIWPGDLSYYVENYDLQLPDEFIEYMKKMEWKIPEEINIDFENLEVR